ncbi:hypothetical protein GCM10022221_67390 [Actinocorallia aurea]
MGVLLADRELGVRKVGPGQVGPHGDVIAGDPGPMLGPWPGGGNELPDVDGQVDAERSRSWALALDPACWPLRRGDLVVEPSTGVEWLVMSADLITCAPAPELDWVKVQAHVLLDGGTRP